MALKIKVDDRQLRKAFRQLQDRQIPFAIANALNIAAEGARTALTKDMQRVFDRPTPYTLRAFYVVKAAPRRLSALVGIRDFAGKGVAAWKYLTPQVQGGGRRMKRFELAMSALSDGQYIVPGRGAQLDAYGNISRGQITKIMSRLSVSSDGAQNMTDRTTQRLRKRGMIAKGARSEYFIAHAKGNGSYGSSNGRPLGVYELRGPGRVEPVLVFTPRRPAYRKRFDPDRVVSTTLNRIGPRAIREALAHEIATAK